MRPLRVALCQLAATSSPSANLDLVARAVSAATAADADLAVLPEATMARFGSPLADVAEPLDGPWAGQVRRLAADAGIVVVAGMFTPAGHGRVRNTLLVTGRDRATGRDVAARYDKVHLFDAFGSCESDTVEPGDALAAVEVGGHRVGLATCYDLRFPAQFTALARAGVGVVVVPASWGDGPGKADQWELLVRARALDSTSWVAACDQADPRTAGLDAHPRAPGGIGHSLVVSPLGEVRGRLGRAPGVLVAEVDADETTRVRRSLPVLDHARPWDASAVPAEAQPDR